MEFLRRLSMIWLLQILTCAIGAPTSNSTKDGLTSRETKIIGGVPAVRGEFPYLISLQVKRGSLPNSHTCGGTLIDMSRVVTSATCFLYITDLSRIVIVAGSYLHSEALNGVEQVRNGKQVHYHPSYNEDNRTNHDIVVVDLMSPFNENVNVRSLQLPSSNQESSGMCTIAGWGETESNPGYMSEVLMKANIAVHSEQQCKSSYSGFDKDYQLCAGGLSEYTGACYGDDGGPMICSRIDGSKYLAGISSWGNGCGSSPTVYMELAKYRTWLDQVTNGGDVQ